ncbi:MAG TPA: competence/damage-inducible protein A [Vicinamibacterales bacterium]|nr:competence/damage-inducible protein A [Vicinamibacterales bacterium]
MKPPETPPPLITAAIIAVGSELLTPAKIDTNSLFITEQLNLLGIEVKAKAVVGDERPQLEHVFQSLLARADLVVCCGGLGPTDDDLTREVVASVLNRPLAEDEAITAHLRSRFASRNLPMPMPESNRRQAMVPFGGRVIANAKGSAPGLWIDHDDRLVLLLPGPPRELRPMLTELVEGPLRERSVGVSLVRRVVRVAGRIESNVDEVLHPLYQEWERATPPIAATILAVLGSIELHVSTRAASREAAVAVLESAVAQTVAFLGADVYSTDGRLLEAVVGDLLVARELRIGVAESCTGGLITSRLTDIAGSSRYVDQAVVVYSNEAKTELLGVPPDLLREHGAVSEPVALAMAEGIKTRARAGVGVAVTGIAGPTGGTPEKPVGTVVVSAVTDSDKRVRTFRFFGEREQVKFQASQAALDMVRRMLAD